MYFAVIYHFAFFPLTVYAQAHSWTSGWGALALEPLEKAVMNFVLQVHYLVILKR